MVRQYRRKRPRQWRDKDKRMRAAVRMRAEGLSLRQIAKELAVSSPQTVANDLARWDRQQTAAAAAPSNVVPLSKKASKSAVQSSPAPGQVWTPGLDIRTTGEALGLTVKEEAMTRAIASLTNRR